MMKQKLLTTSIAMALAMTAASAHAVDFTGYFRSGVGVSQDGDTQSWKISRLGRLGNEADTYTEVGVGQEVYNKDGKSFYVDSMFSMNSDGSNDWESTQAACNFDSKSCSEDATFALRQFNVKAKGLISSNPDAVLWAGKRYYQRHDLHIIDTKYWNISGAGAGLENLKAGPGTISAAWIRNDGDELNVNYLDLRYAGWSPWQGAWTEFGADYALANETDAQKASGTYDKFENSLMLTAELSHFFADSKISQKIVGQYANKGLAKNMVDQGGGWYDVWSGDNSDAKGYRFINTADLPFGDRVMLNYVLTYGRADDYAPNSDIDNTKLFSAVARGHYAWTDYTKTIVEAGAFKEKHSYTSGSTYKESGQKYTLAQAWSAGASFWARPEIRVYASYLKNDGDYDTTFNGNTDNSTWNFGVQAEAWW